MQPVPLESEGRGQLLKGPGPCRLQIMLLETARRYNHETECITFLKDFTYSKDDFHRAGHRGAGRGQAGEGWLAADSASSSQGSLQDGAQGGAEEMSPQCPALLAHREVASGEAHGLPHWGGAL